MPYIALVQFVRRTTNTDTKLRFDGDSRTAEFFDSENGGRTETGQTTVLRAARILRRVLLRLAIT